MCSPTREPPALQLCLPLPLAHSSGPAEVCRSNSLCFVHSASQRAGHPTGFPASLQDSVVFAKSEQSHLRHSEGRKEVRRQQNISLYTHTLT